MSKRGGFVLAYFPEYRFVGSILCIILTFGVRTAAIHWNLKMPAFTRTGSGP